MLAILVLTALGALLAGVPGAVGGYLVGIVGSRLIPADQSCSVPPPDVPEPEGDEPQPPEA